MRRLLPLKIALLSLAIAACVTINVYFPAAAAEKAADQIIDAVTSHGAGATAPSATPPAEPVKPNTLTPSTNVAPEHPSLWLVAADRVLSLLIPAAHAQSANLDVSTPEVRALTASMQQRFGQLSKFFDSGAVGLTADGMVDVRDQNAVPLAERATVKRLVAEDNRDRASLYAEIAKANAHPEWEADIRRTFARRWIERGAQPGWYYQDAGGAWKQK
jgi:uncharacterized protein YdbL (DUF1318 family)